MALSTASVDGYVRARREEEVTAHTIHKELGALRRVEGSDDEQGSGVPD